MGAYSPLPGSASSFGGEEEFVDLVTREVAEPVIRQLDAEGTPFIGLLYAGLILTDDGVKVIEFNARFGDPETQVVLPRLVDPLSELLLAAASGNLEDHAAPAFAEAVAVTVVLASEGYPQAPSPAPAYGTGCRGRRRRRAPRARRHRRERRGLVATGGRVLNVVALGTTFAQARDRAYRALAEIDARGRPAPHRHRRARRRALSRAVADNVGGSSGQSVRVESRAARASGQARREVPMRGHGGALVAAGSRGVVAVTRHASCADSSTGRES